MEPEELVFLAFWVNEVEASKAKMLGRMLGVNFTAGEIRSWSKDGAAKDYGDQDNVLVPLALVLKPELRDSLIKMVGGQAMPLPKEYRKGKNEIVVDMGKVSPQEFIEFVKNKTPPKIPKGG
jgi:hypothetical protein